MIGNHIIVAVPSEAGKSSLVNALHADVSVVQFFVSHTTRAPRAGRGEGCDCRFGDTVSTPTELAVQ